MKHVTEKHIAAHIPQRIGVKFYLETPRAWERDELVGVFHRWIREGKLDGLLIDVADYTHVHQGPGLMIVAHEGHYRLEESDGRLGMEWMTKRNPTPDLESRIRDAAHKALKACQALEAEPALGFRLRGREVRIRFQDRLLAPNSTDTFLAFKPYLQAVLGNLFGQPNLELEWDAGSRAGFDVRLRLDSVSAMEALSGRALAETGV